MLSAIQSCCSLSTQSCSRLVLARIASSTLSIEQRYFATHRPYFKRAEEEQVGNTRERFTRKFREQEDYNTVPLRGKAYDNLGYSGRKGDSEQRASFRGRYERGSQDRRQGSLDYASLWNSNLDRDVPNESPVDPNFTPVKFNHQAPTTPAGNVQEFLTAQGIKFHQPIPAEFAPIQTFEETPFDAGVKSLFKKKGFTTPTPVQSVGWPLVFQNKDVIGVAETGSGKTLTFMLPLAEHVKIQPKKVRSAIPRPRGLILAPTRELAQQILSDSRPYLDVYGVYGTAVYGGSAKFAQLQNLRSNDDFVVGTPGRLMDLIVSRELSLDRVSFTVFDEADRMLDMGFEPQIRKIMERVPTNRRTLMWSATWPREVQSLATDFVQESVRFTVGTDQLTANKKIEQKFIFTDRNEALSKLMTLISQLNPNPSSKMLIFCSTKRSCDQLQWTLEGERIPSETIHGDKAQFSRDQVLRAFKKGDIPILIATDVAARGLDVKDIQTVINFELPKEEESYVHRIGRTARGGSTGTSISFFKPEDIPLAKGLVSILHGAGQEVPPQLLSYTRSSGSPNRPSYGRSSGFNQTRKERW